MATQHPSRRTFLAAGAGLVVAAACSSADDDGGVSAGDSPTTTGDRPIAGSLASADLYVGDDQRFALGVLRLKADKTYDLVRGDEVLVAFAPPGGRAGAPKATTFHADGLPPDRGVYVTRGSFDRPGFWEATILVGDLGGALPFEVKEDNQVPTAGDQAVSVKTPTTADAAGVDPICTRTPACPFHDVSLDEALEGDLPMVVMFSTPAYCISRVCGPVLDLLVGLAPEFEGRASFIHVEIWKDRSTEESSPGVEAWGLETEPWVFGIDPDGEIVARLDGAFDQSELAELVAATVGEPES